MRPLVIAAGLAGILAPFAGAQNTTITLSGFNGTMGTAAVTDFDNGSMQSATAIGYTVSISPPNPNTARTATVSIRASGGLGGTKLVGDLEWRRNDLATWNAMTTTNATVQTQSAFSGNGSSFSNSIWLRVLLNWASDPAATYSTTITITLSVTSP
jgi:hypothetical protein